jgi:hypothetical protein
MNVRLSCVMLRGAQDVSKQAGRSTTSWADEAPPELVLT